MKKLLRIATTNLLLAGSFLLMTSQASSQDVEYEFRVEPAVREGTPRVLAEPDPPGAELRFLATNLESGAILADTTLGAGAVKAFPLPEVKEDTYVEVTVHESGQVGETEPLFRWHTLRRPSSKMMMDYAGKRDRLAPPEDFEEYWQRAKEELAAVPLEPEITELEEKATETGRLFRVVLPTVRDTKIVCWYTVPHEAFEQGNDKKFPAMIVMPGYGAAEPPLDRTADGLITLSVNPRHHGPSKEYWTSPVEHLAYKLDEPEEQYYKLGVLDCLRAAEFLFSREEVDADRVAAEGGSQGGYFSVALAALEPRIACAVSNVTAFSALEDGMILNTAGHATSYREMLAEGTEKAGRIRQSLRYMDGANLAEHVQAPIQFNMGGVDPVCSYIGGIVLYNRVPEGVAKDYHVFPGAQHEVPGGMRQNNAEWVEKWLELEDVPSLPGAVLDAE